MKKKEKNKLIKWFIDEGALTQENNLYLADRIFQANSFVNWIKEKSIGKTLDKKEIEESMLAMFLQKKINLEWKNGTINISDILLDEEETNAVVNMSKME